MRKNIGMLAAAVLILLGTARYLTLNAEYPNPPVHIAQRGEIQTVGGYSFTLTDWQSKGIEAISKILPDSEFLVDFYGEPYSDDQVRVIFAQVEIVKEEDDDSELDLTDIGFESGAWHNQFDMELFEILNGEGSLVLDLKMGERKEMTFPIIMYDFQFQKKKWEKIEKKPVDMVIKLYPEKYVLRIAGKEI